MAEVYHTRMQASESRRRPVLIFDFGSQYAQLIARRVREHHVYSEIVPHGTPASEIRARNASGVILTGGPASCYEPGAPQIDLEVFRTGVPVLGICYGMQLAARTLGVKVAQSPAREYGRTTIEVDLETPLFRGLPRKTTVWMSHGDVVTDLGGVFRSLGRTAHSPVAAAVHKDLPVYGVQFHPEVTHTPEGGWILRNFLVEVCKAPTDWTVASYIDVAVDAIRAQVGERGRVVCGLSGGVDSSV